MTIEHHLCLIAMYLKFHIFKRDFFFFLLRSQEQQANTFTDPFKYRYFHGMRFWAVLVLT